MIKKIFALLMILIVALCAPYAFALTGEPIGQITSLKGEVSAIHAGESKKSALELNAPVHLGDTIQTAASSKVQILMEDDSLLNLGEKASIILKDHIYQPEKNLRDSVYKLIRGKVRVVVGKLFSDPDSDLEVETPTSVIGIRMTEFIVWVVSPELTIVITLKGAVIARNIRSDLICSETVHEGYESQIARDACPTATEKSPTEKMEDILLETATYMPAPAYEMFASRESLKESVRTALTIAPAVLLARSTGLLGTGMMGTAPPVAGGAIIGPLTANASTIQTLSLQAGEANLNIKLPTIPPIPPIIVVPVILLPFLGGLPPPPDPPH
jgi:hypothetical protein